MEITSNSQNTTTTTVKAEIPNKLLTTAFIKFIRDFRSSI
jgi:hypothetical protein